MLFRSAAAASKLTAGGCVSVGVSSITMRTFCYCLFLRFIFLFVLLFLSAGSFFSFCCVCGFCSVLFSSVQSGSRLFRRAPSRASFFRRRRARHSMSAVVSKGLEHINTSHNTSHTQVSHRDASGLLDSRQVLGRSRCSRQNGNVTEAATAERKRWRRRVDRPPPERPPSSPVRTTGAGGNKMDTYIDTLANYLLKFTTHL